MYIYEPEQQYDTPDMKTLYFQPEATQEHTPIVDSTELPLLDIEIKISGKAHPHQIAAYLPHAQSNQYKTPDSTTPQTAPAQSSFSYFDAEPVSDHQNSPYEYPLATADDYRGNIENNPLLNPTVRLDTSDYETQQMRTVRNTVSPEKQTRVTFKKARAAVGVLAAILIAGPVYHAANDGPHAAVVCSAHGLASMFSDLSCPGNQLLGELVDPHNILNFSAEKK